MGTQSKLIPGLKEMSTEKLRDLFKGSSDGVVVKRVFPSR